MDKPVIVALDYQSADEALALALQLDSNRCRVKVGKELFTRAGPPVVEKLVELGFDVFLDMKYHDIPNTVAGAIKAAAELGVWMVNVHASGGKRMMVAAVEAVETSAHKPLLIGVTVLTSMDKSDLLDIGITGEPVEYVKKLAGLAQSSGLDGVVCSAAEAVALRDIVANDFSLVTPGIRPIGANADDQRRVITPEQAINNGSNYLVIGRPITKAENPAQALEDILTTLIGG